MDHWSSTKMQQPCLYPLGTPQPHQTSGNKTKISWRVWPTPLGNYSPTHGRSYNPPAQRPLPLLLMQPADPLTEENGAQTIMAIQHYLGMKTLHSKTHQWPRPWWHKTGSISSHKMDAIRPPHLTTTWALIGLATTLTLWHQSNTHFSSMSNSNWTS